MGERAFVSLRNGTKGQQPSPFTRNNYINSDAHIAHMERQPANKLTRRISAALPPHLTRSWFSTTINLFWPSDCDKNEYNHRVINGTIEVEFKIRKTALAKFSRHDFLIRRRRCISIVFLFWCDRTGDKRSDSFMKLCAIITEHTNSRCHWIWLRVDVHVFA